MNPLLFTFTFLTLMGILTSSELSHFCQESLSHHLYTKHNALQAEKEEAIESFYLQDLKCERLPKQDSLVDDHEEPKPSLYKKKSPQLNYMRSRPPNNSRLNFYDLLHGKEEHLYPAAASLMRQLYPTLPQDVEYRLLDALLAKKEETLTFSSPEELASVDLGDRELQEIFCAMMKGRPSLLNYITFDQRKGNLKKINILFAPKELLLAFLSREEVENFLRERERIIYEIENNNTFDLDKRKKRSQFAHELANLFDLLIGKPELKKLFDFTLGHPGTVLFLEDPKTHELLREPCPKKAA